LRYRLAYDHRLCRTVLHVFVREPDGTLRFHAVSTPTDADVRRVVVRVRWRLERLGLAGATISDDGADLLPDESAALAALSRAAILGRTALGSRAGRGPVRWGADPDAPWVERHVPLHAHDGGFDLHAAVHVEAGDRERLERLCQYLCRPPLAQGRLHRLRDGRIAVALQRRWADGTTHLVFTPVELLQRLVPLVPRPRINLLLYHGVLAPNAPWRREVVARAEPEEDTLDSGPPATPADEEHEDAQPQRARPKYRAWADLMRRAFETDVLACPRCGERMVVLATIVDPAVIHRILTHLGLASNTGDPLPVARGSP
jgi:hypothetical protein